MRKAQKREGYIDLESLNTSNSITSRVDHPYKSKIENKKKNNYQKINPFKEQKKNSIKIFPTLEYLLSSPKQAKYLFYFFLILLIYFLYHPIMNIFHTALFQNPNLASLFSDLTLEWHNRTLKGLFLISFVGTLFFISIPPELIFLQYLETSTNTIVLIATVTLASILAMIFNYIIGFIFGQGILRMVLKDKFERYQNITQNWGTTILIIGNILPGPIELLALLFGASKYPVKQYIYITGLCRVVKFVLLIIIAVQFPYLVKYILFG